MTISEETHTSRHLYSYFIILSIRLIQKCTEHFPGKASWDVQPNLILSLKKLCPPIYYKKDHQHHQFYSDGLC